MTTRTHKDITSFFFAQIAGVATSTVGFGLLLLIGAMGLGVTGSLLNMSEGVSVDGLQKLGTAVMIWAFFVFFGVPMLGGAVAGATRTVLAPRTSRDGWTRGLGCFAAGSLSAALCYTPLLMLNMMGLVLMVSKGQHSKAFFANQNMMLMVSAAMIASGMCAFLGGRVAGMMKRNPSAQAGTAASLAQHV